MLSHTQVPEPQPLKKQIVRNCQFRNISSGIEALGDVRQESQAETAEKQRPSESGKPAIYLIQVTPRCSVRAGVEDYPRNLAEFERRFATQQACRAYLEQLRWSEGFRCPRCDGTKAWRVRERWWQCAGCAHQTSVTAGTIFQDTRTPLPTWFRAMWWVTNQKSGVSALGLQRALGLGRTAWTTSMVRLTPRRGGRDPSGSRRVGPAQLNKVHCRGS